MGKTLNLYEVSQLLRDAVAAADVDTDTGEIAPDWAKFLDDIEMERNVKLLNCARLYKEWDAYAEMIRDQEKELAARRHAHEARAERIKDWMSVNMTPGEKIEDGAARLSWRKSARVEIFRESDIPEKYVKTTISYDKATIRADLKDGKAVPGTMMVETNSLQIK